MRLAPWVASLIVAAMGTVATSARARARAVSVTSDSCPNLQSAEIERVLDLELAAVTKAWTADEHLGVELTCDAESVRIVADDPVTEKRLSRAIPLASLRSDADRTVALIASQLFLTSWAERLLAPRATPPVVTAPPPAVAKATDTLVHDAIASPSVARSIGVFVGPRLRALHTPIVGLRAGARPMLAFGDHARLLLELSYERGVTSRASGDVTYALAGAAIGGGYRTSRRGALALAGHGTVGVAYLSFAGDPDALAIGSAVSGVVGEAAIGVGPELTLGPVRAGVEIGAGFTFPRAIAHVARDERVSIHGLWTGAVLTLALGDDPR